MANTPSMNPTQVSARNTEGGNRFNAVLFSTLDALEEAKIPFALIGGVAVSGQGRPRSTHDVDIFVRPEDAESVMVALADKGFRTDRIDVEWLFKAFKDEILVDVIFRSRGDLYFDEEMQAHRRWVEYHGRKVPVVSPEDLIIIKCAVHYEGGPHHWHDALALLSHATIDWSYLLRRARRAPRRLLALLLYAQSSDILIPNSIIMQLYQHIFHDDHRTHAPPATPQFEAPFRPRVAPAPTAAPAASAEGGADYLLEHLLEALAEDARTAQHDLKVTVDDRRIIVKGECQTDERCTAVMEVIRTVAPAHELINHIQITPLASPVGAEAIS